ncbi:helix-turn-helix domain-containing protein [Bacillus cereus]
MNDMKLQDVMTTNEASYRWNINESTLRMRIKNSPIIDELKTQGLIKYFLKPGNKRGEYLFTVEAMERLYGKEKEGNRKPSAPTKTARTFHNIISIQKG